MKRYLHIYFWLAAIMMMICSTATMFAQTKVTSLDQLKAGSVIKIYPRSSSGWSHYGDEELALACSDNGEDLTSFEKAGSGDSWTLVDTGDGYYYLRNGNGCYWSSQGDTSSRSMTCTTSKNSAVKVRLTWNSNYGGVCFWNVQNGKALNNLYGYCERYNWFSTETNYNEDANCTFDVIIGVGKKDPEEEPTTAVTSIDQLKSGTHIYIKKGTDGLSCIYGEEMNVLSLVADFDSWTIDGGRIKNDDGYYWTMTDVSGSKRAYCSKDWKDACSVTPRMHNGQVVFVHGQYTLSAKKNRSASWEDTGLLYDNTHFDVLINNTRYVIVDGIRYVLNINTKTAKICANGNSDYVGDLIIPEYVEYEGEKYEICYMTKGIFEKCTSIDARYYSGKIPEDAFKNCDNLISIIFGNVESIGQHAFYGCNLKDVTFGSVGSVDDYAFANTAFSFVKAFSNKSYHVINSSYLLERNSGGVICKANNIKGDYVLPHYVTYEGTDYEIIGFKKGIFKYCTSVDARYYNGNIEDEDFVGCSELKSIRFGNVGNIGNNAFSDCPKLEYVTFGKVESVGLNAFKNTHFSDVKDFSNKDYHYLVDADIAYLVEKNAKNAAVMGNDYTGNLVIPQYVNDGGIDYEISSFVRDDCFAKCTSLDARYFNGRIDSGFSSSETLTSVRFGNIGSVDMGKLGIWTALKTIVLGNVKHIFGGNYNTSIENVEIADVDTIDTNVLNVLYSLAAIKFGKVISTKQFSLFGVTVTSEMVSNKHFQLVKENGCRYLVDLTLGEATLLPNDYSGDLVLPEYVSVNEKKYPIKHLYSNQVQKCFEHCTSVVAKYYDGDLAAFTFYGCDKLKSVTLGDVQKVVKHSFYWCSALTTFTLGNVDVVENEAFYVCEKLKNISIGNVNAIEKNAFYGCLNLNEITLSRVKAFDKEAIDKHRNIADEYEGYVILNYSSPTPPEFEVPNFVYAITVPEEAINQYKASAIWGKIDYIAPLGAFTFADVADIRYLLNDSSKEAAVMHKKTYAGNFVVPAKIEYNDDTYIVNAIDAEAFWDEDHLFSILTLKVEGNIKKITSEHFIKCKHLASVDFQDVGYLGPNVLSTVANVKFATIEKMDPDAFVGGGMGNLELGNMTPPVASALPEHLTFLYVQADAVEAYKAQTPWSSVKYIVPIGTILTDKITMDGECDIHKGETKIIEVKLSPENVTDKRLKWESSNEKIVSVNNYGEITAVSVGYAFISATTQDATHKKAVMQVNVLPPYMQKINFGASEYRMQKNMTLKLALEITPEDADKKQLKWTSDNENVAIVDSVGTVTGKGIGETIIRVEATDGSGQNAMVKLNVCQLKTLTMPRQFTATRKDTLTNLLTTDLLPVNYHAIKWTIADRNVVSLTNDSIPYAKGVGVTTVTATALDGSDLQASSEVTVTPLLVSKIVLPESLELNYVSRETLYPEIYPKDADNKVLKWTSDNETLATVDEEGCVTPHVSGTVNITATATDGSGASATCKLTMLVSEESDGLEQLQPGCVVKIYNWNFEEDKAMHYEGENASEERTDAGSEWILHEADDEYFYIQNKLGYYWTRQGDELSFTKDPKLASPICIMHDSGSAFALLYKDDGVKCVDFVARFKVVKEKSIEPTYLYLQANDAKYVLNFKTKKARLCNKTVDSGYEGSITVPQTLSYEGAEYAVTAIQHGCLRNCTSVDAKYLEAKQVLQELNLSNIESLALGDLDTIPNEMFRHKSRLRRLVLGHVKRICKGAFWDCGANDIQIASVKVVEDAFVRCPGVTASSFGNCDVDSIYSYAFYGCENLTSMPFKNVKYIGKYAFCDCLSLKNVSLGESNLSYLGESAFANCPKLITVEFAGVDSIPNNTFDGCVSLKTFKTTKGDLLCIGREAFKNCSSLESLTFGNVGSVKENAFEGCNNLQSVSFGTIGNMASNVFHDIPVWGEIKDFSNKSYDLAIVDGLKYLLEKQKKEATLCANNYSGAITVPQAINFEGFKYTIRHFLNSVFDKCTSIDAKYLNGTIAKDNFANATSIVLGDIECIENGAFGDNSPIQSVVFGNIGTIEEGAFSDCSYLQSIIFCNVDTVKEKAFVNCSGLRAVSFGNVEYLAENAFCYDWWEKKLPWNNLKDFSNKSYHLETINGIMYLLDLTSREGMVCANGYSGDMVIPQVVDYDGAKCEVKYYQDDAFEECSSIDAKYLNGPIKKCAKAKSIVWGDIDIIENDEFSNHINLQKVSFGNVRSIGNNAFQSCANLQEVSFGNVGSIGNNAFENCRQLKSVVFGDVDSIGDKDFSCCYKLQTLTFGNVESIGNNAFEECDALNAIKFGDVNSIGDKAFINCRNLQSVSFGKVEKLGKKAFYADRGSTFDIALDDIEKVSNKSYRFATIDGIRYLLELNDRVGTVCANDYSGSVVIPKSVNYEGVECFIRYFKNNAFQNCTSIDARYLTGKLTAETMSLSPNIKSLLLGDIEYIDNSFFQSKYELETVSFGNVKRLGNRCFYGCENLKSASFGNIESIGDKAFNLCKSMEELSYGEVESMGNDVFGTNSLPVVILPKTLKSIGDLNNMVYRCYVENPEDLKCSYPNNAEAFYVKASVVEKYRTTAPWNSIAERIHPMGDVFVEEIELPESLTIRKLNKKIPLRTVVYPSNAGNPHLEWTTSNSRVATVDDNGNVTALYPGEATIKAMSTDGSGVFALCHVIVSQIAMKSAEFKDLPTEIVVGTNISDVKKHIELSPIDSDILYYIIYTTDPDVLEYDENTDMLVTKGTSGVATLVVRVNDTYGNCCEISQDIRVAEPTHIGNITMGDVKIILDKRHLKVEGLAENDIVQIVNTIGFTVYKGTEHEMDLDAPGIYIIKVKGKTLKFSVK